MKPHGFLRLVSTLLIGAWVASCAHTQQTATPRELFTKIEIGMSRSEVDAVLGAPIVPQLSPDTDAWYLPPPSIQSHESPFAPGTIGVRFASDGRVASKRLNPQFRDR
jgi:hypothetical protein